MCGGGHVTWAHLLQFSNHNNDQTLELLSFLASGEEGEAGWLSRSGRPMPSVAQVTQHPPTLSIYQPTVG